MAVNNDYEMAETTRNEVSRPYLDRLKEMQHAFPALGGFLGKLNNSDVGRKAVDDFYRKRKNRSPGRCICLDFSAKDKVTALEGYTEGFKSAQVLDDYLQKHPARQTRKNGQKRLFILEDMEPEYVEALGYHLGIDPLVFSEQMNTWNFTDSQSVPHRTLPSMVLPRQSFTLRYYEIRTLEDDHVDPETFQMTFAVNRRRYERWRDVDAPQMGETKDKEHALVRRCASFWTSQQTSQKADDNEKGWDAVILVDPGMAQASVPEQPLSKSPSPASQPGPNKDEATKALILQDWKKYADRISMWSAHPWEETNSVCQRDHSSRPYHQGCATMTTPPAPLPLPDSTENVPSTSTANTTDAFINHPIPCSPLDEQVHHWLSLAPPSLIAATHIDSSNSAYYLLKQIAQYWQSQLELLNCTVAKGEYISDDYQAKIDDRLTSAQWKADLTRVTAVSANISYCRRQVNHFWRALVLDLERLGCGRMDEPRIGAVDRPKDVAEEWDAVLGAQRDFIALSARLTPLRERVEVLANIATELASLRSAFKGIRDGEMGMRLSLFAAVVFPLTLIASIFSMGDEFLPGKSQFWLFWCCSLPLAAVLGVALLYGRRPDRIFTDLKGWVLGQERLRARKEKKEETKRFKMGEKRKSGFTAPQY